MADLFDTDRAEQFGRRGALSDAERKRLQKRKPGNGYAAPPGSGPQGMRCWDCAHKRLVESPARRRFWKCFLRKWTKGAATDIRLRTPACSRFVMESEDGKER